MRTRFETEAQRNSEKAFCISEWNHLFSRVSRSHNWSGKNEKPGNDVEYGISMHYADFPAIFFQRYKPDAKYNRPLSTGGLMQVKLKQCKSSYTPYSKMAAILIFFCLLAN